MKKLTWTTIQKRVNDLVPQTINPRSISESQLEKLKASFEKFDLVEIPAINTDGTILAGHQRIKVLKLLGRGNELIDVRIPNRKLTKAESDEYLIGSNKLGGEFDFELLKEFDFNMLLDTGFEKLELTEFWDKEKEVEDDTFDEEKELQKITNPTTKQGDIIHLGKHKILCGDSTKPENLKRLLGNEKASMIYSDPVYNIAVDYNGGIGGKQSYGGNVYDTRSEQEYYDFLTKAIESSLSVSEENVHVFYWCDQIYIGFIQDIYRKYNIKNKRVTLWLKNNQNPVPSVAFNKVYEPCVYGVRGNPYLSSVMTNNTEVMNQELGTGNELLEQVNDIWTSKRLNGKEYEHATSKPVSLHTKAIKRCTKPNDIIIDSFLGSGSTLLCAEQLGRRVYGCELEPVYCDLIIKRFETMTGMKARVEHAKE